MSSDSVKLGFRSEVVIDGHATTVGFIQLRNGQWQASYRPLTNYRMVPGAFILVSGYKFSVQASRQSSLVPKMVVLDLEEIKDARQP